MHEHFEGTCGWGSLEFMTLEKVPHGGKPLLLYTEAKWIKLLEAIEFGWNDFEVYNPYLRIMYGSVCEEDPHEVCRSLVDDCLNVIEELKIQHSKLRTSN